VGISVLVRVAYGGEVEVEIQVEEVHMVLLLQEEAGWYQFQQSPRLVVDSQENVN
jgi:hypothetical protein